MKFETERLYISEITVKDAPFILELYNEADYLHFIGDKNLRTLGDAKKNIEEKFIPVYKEKEYGYYLVSLKSDNTPIGTCGLMKRDGLDNVDLGFAFLKEFRGKGYAYEATKRVLDFGLEELKMSPIAAITTIENISSSNLLERMGFKHERNLFIPNDPEELRLFIHY
jgi:ribosomal-protein-alanine N-acetyltransferase